MDLHPDRRHPAHHPPIERMHAPTILLVTVCVPGRRPLLAHPDVHRALCDIWLHGREWSAGRYTIMPDHLHVLCTPAVQLHEPVGQWVRYWKSALTRRFPERKPLWQRDCWDTQMRSREHYDERVHYVAENPVRAGLVERSEAWPYQGKINDLIWW